MSDIAIYRPPLTSAAAPAVMITVVAYFGLKFTISDPESILSIYPFGFASLVGLAIFLLLVMTNYKKSGITVDDEGLTHLGSKIHLPWSAIEEVRIDDTEGRTTPIRTVTVTSGADRVQFGDVDSAMLKNEQIVSLANAPLLLSTIASRTRGTALYPPSWHQELVEEPSEEPATPQKLGWSARNGGVGLLAFLFKIGPKFFGIVLKLLKTIKPGAALVTVGAYALLLSWEFGIAIVVLVLFHELGHVFAMWRSGVEVKGIYLIPFFGGAAVSKGIAKTRWNSTYIALNGPVWGTLLCCALAAVYVLTDAAWPFLGAVAAWGALINLFNLLPILPLDGGRVLTNLAHSSSRTLAAPVTFASLIFGGALAYLASLELLVLMVFFGLMEFSGHLGALPYRESLALIGGRPMKQPEIIYFSKLIASPGKSQMKNISRNVRDYTFRRDEAAQTPMSPRQVAIVIVGYVALVAVLAGLLWSLGQIQGAGNPLELLH